MRVNKLKVLPLMLGVLMVPGVVLAQDAAKPADSTKTVTTSQKLQVDDPVVQKLLADAKASGKPVDQEALRAALIKHLGLDANSNVKIRMNVGSVPATTTDGGGTQVKTVTKTVVAGDEAEAAAPFPDVPEPPAVPVNPPNPF